MNVYVETNFVLELTLLQNEHESCKHILELSKWGQANLVLPAYSFAEPNEKLNRLVNERNDLRRHAEDVLNQLSRSIPYKMETTTLQEQIVSLVTRSEAEERQRFIAVRDQLLQIAEIIPLDGNILASAATYEKQFGLSPQDAPVVASILWHLNETSPDAACLLEKDSRDFDDPDIRDLFAQVSCKLIFGFDNGLNYLQSQI